MKKVLISVGTRPNIIKITQFKKLAEEFGLEIKLLHTGQHYDHKMAQVFYDQFRLEPDFRQDLKPGTVLEQITQIMLNVTKVINEYQPDILLTPGDVNSTFAAAYAAYQAGIPVGHIESGLRSLDRTMPEEVNRILTDEITDHFFITEPSGMSNLQALGKASEQLHMVGNTMIDTLVAFEHEIDQSQVLNETGVGEDYALFTFHRPGNVDSKDQLLKLVELIQRTAEKIEVVFPIHPRTVKTLKEFELYDQIANTSNTHLIDPLDYFSFQKLVKHARAVITDSGGIQEETTFRQVPCLTIRPNTERPVTTDIGSNTLLDFNLDQIEHYLKEILSGDYKTGEIPELWDGNATKRILTVLANS